MRDNRGRAATLKAFIVPSSGALIAIALGSTLAGCVSGSDTFAGLSPSAADTSKAAAASGTEPTKTAAAAPTTETASSVAKDGTETDSTGHVAALALAGESATSPAVAATQTMIASTGEKVAVPSPSPTDQQAAATTAPAATSASGRTTVATTGTVAVASNAQPAAATAAPTQTPAAQPSPLARLFSNNQAGKTGRVTALSSRSGQTATPAAASGSSRRAAPIVPLASDDATDDEPDDAEPAARVELASAATGGDDALPGVELHSIYSLPTSGTQTMRAGDQAARVQLASAAGSARLAPGFLAKQSDTVQTACLKPALLGLLKMIEYHFGEQVIITSGYRGPVHNAAVGGVRHSEHMKCEAADIQVPGESKWQVASYVRSLPGRGGVGTYCHTDSVHVDIGEQRDWNWRCRRGR